MLRFIQDCCSGMLNKQQSPIVPPQHPVYAVTICRDGELWYTTKIWLMGVQCHARRSKYCVSSYTLLPCIPRWSGLYKVCWLPNCQMNFELTSITLSHFLLSLFSSLGLLDSIVTLVFSMCLYWVISMARECHTCFGFPGKGAKPDERYEKEIVKEGRERVDRVL